VDWKYWDYYASPEGDREDDQDQDRNLTLDYNGSFAYEPMADVTSRFSFGGQVYEESNYGLNGFDATFAAQGLVLVGDGTERDVSESRSRVRSGGFFLQEALGWQDRLFVTAGMRWDGFSTFGEGFGLAAYPKLSSSYVISDESFWPLEVVEQLKLRAAWGQSGRAPGAFDAEKTWEATSADEAVPAVVLDNFGNPDLGPEKSTELELGFDASAFDGRVSLEFTKYNQKTNDALVSIPPVYSGGQNNGVLSNVGRVDNWGTETMLNVVPVRTNDVEWSVGVQYSTNDSEVKSRGVLTGGGSIRVGYPLYGNRGDVLRTFCSEEDADYVNGCDFDNDGDIDVFDPDALYDPSQPPRLTERFLGPLFPTDIVSLSTRLTLWQSLTLDVLGEGQYGHVRSVGHAYQNMRRNTWDNPVWPYCAAINAVWTQGDRTTLTNQQVVECTIEYGAQGVWTQKSKADFFKLRSATLSWRVPEEWVPGARSAQLAVQGKNLFMFTDYIGLDPEAADNGAGDTTPNDYYTYGPPRTFIFGVTVNF
jgi:outer membrane receptor protein involved in Fe transport